MWNFPLDRMDSKQEVRLRAQVAGLMPGPLGQCAGLLVPDSVSLNLLCVGTGE